MPPTSMKRTYPAALIVAAQLVILSCLAAESQTKSATDGSSFKPIGLFDYQNYKNIYNKQYRTSLEDSTRRCYFYARAMAVFVSGVNYKYRVRDHFKALNEMSDWSPEERDRIKNRRIHPMVTRSMTKKREESLAFLPAEGERPEETLRKFLESKIASNHKYQDLLNELYQTGQPGESSRSPRQSDRKKRAAVEGPRDFSFERLVNFDASPETYTKPVTVPTNNPNYKFIVTMSRGLSDPIEEVKLITPRQRDANGNEIGSLESQLESELGSLGAGESNSALIDTSLRDEIFLDHRNSPCMNKIRSQGQCGSCYAFATMTIIEWIYCQKKGLLVDFSEQYMIDCGKGRIDDMDGCLGASIPSVYDFVRNFGVELRSKYPYTERKQVCPYNERTDLATTGYIRMEFDAFKEIPIDSWPEALETQPLYLVIELVDDFYEYGGGVYDGAQCSMKSDEMSELHSVVLVGHGREDGREFWLIRNSHGRNWGEQGYFKLAKSAPQCIYLRSAFAMTWKNNREVEMRPYRNRLHNDAILARKVMAKNKKKKKLSKNKSLNLENDDH